MSDTTCQPGDTTGFPLQISQSLFTEWPATKNAQSQIQKLVVPTDFTVQWGPSTQTARISVTQTGRSDASPGIFQIRGISTITDSTTLTYGTASYKCSGVLSIVQNQHRNFCQDTNALYEVILAFQIANKSMNPSSPDIILLTRPIIFSTWNSSSFWPAVDEACLRNSPQTIAADLSTMFGYNQNILMPMISYQTCLPVKLLNYKSNPYSYGSIRVRVNVVPQPIYMVASENGLGKCSSIRKYTLITEPRRPVDIFDNSSANTILQFRDGYGSDLYPVQTKENMIPNEGATLSAFTDILHKIEILVPEEFLGKSLSDISKATVLPQKKKEKKAFKCYTIDPNKDIVNDQIMIDPTTGECLRDTLKKEALESAGGDPIYMNGQDTSGIMPGDIETIITTICVVIGTILLLVYLGYISHLIIYRGAGFHEALPHIFGFTLAFIALILMGLLLGSEKSKSQKTDSSVDPY
jgi:hypothetical protein